MRPLSLVLSLALAGATLAAVPAVQSTAAGQPAPAKPSITDRMKGEAEGAVRISTQRATGEIGMVRTTGDLMPDRDGASRADAADKATAYLRTYAAAFGARARELRQVGVTTDRYGWTVRFDQRYQGVPVFGARLLANVDRAGALKSVNGFAAPDLRLSVQPTVSKAEATRRAVAEVRLSPSSGQRDDTVSTKGLKGVAHLVIYRMGSVRGVKGEAVLAYQVEVTNHTSVREMVFIDARSGKLVNRYSMLDAALDRRLIEANGSSNPATFVQVWKEGDPFPGALNQDQQQEVTGTGNAYWLFRDTFGRDSYDGAGHTMTTVNNDGRINCPNANWNGTTTNYCNGVTSDDVVAHEWGHAYTEYTSGLIYQWQSGALNESYSDVWGETADLINGEQDAGEGDLTATRPVGQCSAFFTPKALVTINSPATIAKDCATGGYLGPRPLPTITGDVVAPTDAVESGGGTATDGCSTYNQVVTGKIVLVDRGLCTFVAKAQVAKAAGAAAVIIGNRDNSPVGFTSPDQTLPPTVSIGLGDREAVRSALAAGQAVSVTIKDNSGPRATSYRWLVGEKSTAFGGAIRDMWEPTCEGDPGKVSDSEYKCSTDDNGGVHGNSGVPNHTYALVVDGGTYNGVTVAGIGLDKAANIWWYNQTHFLIPNSGFPEFADGLQASCSALTGAAIKKVSTVPSTPSPAAPAITAADCQQIANAISATQLRAEPTQCNFKPLFSGTATPCGKGTKESVIWKDDFESGLVNWTQSRDIVFAGGKSYPWIPRTNAPGHAGGVAYTQDPDVNACTNGAGDISSRNSMTSPAVHVPNGTTKGLRMSFDQSIASEATFDGGNVKLSVNGSQFAAIPKSAYLLNGPNMTLLSAATNSNPMAGELAWSGSDGGKLTTAWGTSQLDLSAAGVQGGDTIQLRFDFGRDCGSGVDGWYVDNVAISLCKSATKLTAVHQPDPAEYGTASSVKVTIANQDTTGGNPTGEVQLTDGSGVVSTGNLVGGIAELAVPSTYPIGTHVLTVSYLGGGAFDSASTPVVIQITKHGKAVTETTVKKPQNPPAFKHDFRVRVAVAADGSALTGKVRITMAGKTIGSGKLVDGKVRITITKNLSVGKHRLVAKYAGSDEALPSKDRFSIKIVG